MHYRYIPIELNSIECYNYYILILLLLYSLHLYSSNIHIIWRFKGKVWNFHQVNCRVITWQNLFLFSEEQTYLIFINCSRSKFDMVISYMVILGKYRIYADNSLLVSVNRVNVVEHDCVFIDHGIRILSWFCFSYLSIKTGR